jgi:hypothetical protein
MMPTSSHPKSIAQQNPTANRTVNLWWICVMILAAALFRMLPSPEYRPPNLAPIGAMALFGGAAIVDRRLAFAIPLAAMLISDLFIEFDASRLWVYGAIGLITLLGRTLQNHRRQPMAVIGGSLAASLLFFVVTNFGVWLMSGWYTHTVSELARCYALAIPFFHHTVAGDLLFSGLLFGAFAWLESREASAPAVSPNSQH